MNDHPSYAALQRHADDETPAAEGWAIVAHLRDCAECRERVAANERLVAAVAQLPSEIQPPEDLWEGIRARIEGGSQDLHMPRREVAAGRRSPRRVAFVGWAAAIAAALLLGLALGSQLPRPETPDLVTESVPAATPSEPSVGTLAGYDEPSYNEAIADLQAILAQSRGQLRPETVAAVEENLAIIDEAIDESRQALLSDPANEHLHKHIMANMQTKLQLLRMVTGAVAAEI